MRARGPLAAFAAFGVFWGAWGVVLPAIKEQTGASVSELGLALLATAAAALPSMLVTGRFADRLGPRTVPATLVLFAAAVTLPAFADSVGALALALVAVGVGSGALDVAINVAATALEAEGARVMQKAHALFSAGFLVGAVACGLARQAGAGPVAVLGTSAGILALVALANRGTPTGTAEMPARARRLIPSRPLVVLGLLCAVAFVVESGIENWSALFLETELDASPAWGGLGPGFFAAAMVGGRSLGQVLGARVGDRGLLAGGSFLAAAGLALAATAPALPPALLGFFLGGAGVSVAAPVFFGAAGRGSPAQERGSSVAAVTTVSYLGFLAGPPLIGGISGALGLRAGIGFLAVVAGVLALAAASLAQDALPLRRVQHPARGRVS